MLNGSLEPMVPAAIIIELAPVDAPPALTAAMVDACNHGPEAGIDCALATEDNSTVSSRLAVVTWRSPSHASVDVQVGVQGPHGGVWSTRHLDFAESDAEVERWRAVGLVIATLARQSDEAAKKPPEPAPAPKPVVAPPPAPPASPARRAPRWTLDLAGNLARGTKLLDVRGGSLRVSRLLLAPGFHANAGARYDVLAASSVELRWVWLTAGVGLSVPLSDPRITLDTRLEPTFALANATFAAADASASGKLWGLREGVGIAWWPSGWVGLALSLEAAQLNRATVARLVAADGATEQTLRVGAVTWGASLGLRFAFGAAR